MTGLAGCCWNKAFLTATFFVIAVGESMAATGSCLLQVDDQTYLNGLCDITMEKGGSFSIRKRRDNRYSAYVRREGDFSATGTLNGIEGHKGRSRQLGQLNRRGACWINDHVTVCAWRRGTRPPDFPSEFVGVWSGSETPDIQCNKSDFGTNDGVIRIQPLWIDEWEGGCNLVSLSPHSSSSVRVSLDCSGEGMSWKSDEEWQVTQAGEIKTFRRMVLKTSDSKGNDGTETPENNSAVQRAISYRQCTNSEVASSGSSSVEPQVIRGRCHMGGCGFTQVLSMREIARNQIGTLIGVQERSEYVEAPIVNDEPQWNQIQTPKFSGPGTGYAFCSLTMPAVIYYVDEANAYYADVFTPGNSESVYGANTSSHLYYWAICHNRFIGEESLGEKQLSDYALALGYRKLPEGVEGQFSFRTKKQLYDFLKLPN